MLTTVLPYDLWIDEALRGVIRKAMRLTAEQGLPGAHHFYVTFATTAPGVEMSPDLKARYPSEMTIVLQHQFWDLQVWDDAFAVTLKFQGRSSRIRIPLDAITNFGDPSINFGIQLRLHGAAAKKAALPPAPADGALSSEEVSDAAPHGEVIALDSFRKK